MKHYAGKVKYTVGGWVERNMDSIPQSFNDTLQTSQHQARSLSTSSNIPFVFGLGWGGGLGGGRERCCVFVAVVAKI